MQVYVGCNENTHVCYVSCNAYSCVCNPRLRIKIYKAGVKIMHQDSCTSSVLVTSILICPFVYQHEECQHLDGEVPFGLITTGSVKSKPSEYSLDVEFNYASNKLS